MTSPVRIVDTVTRTALAGCISLGALGCGSKNTAPKPGEGTAAILESGDEAAERALNQMLDREFPKHGLVTGMQLIVRDAPSPEGKTLGWLRVGTRIRTKSDRVTTATCSTGWYALYPRGFACAGEGIKLGDTDPSGDFVASVAAKNSPLPYTYYFVKDVLTPEYHRMPSRDEQRATAAFVERYTAVLALSAERAQKMLKGTLPGEPAKPAVVNRFLARGFFIAGAGIEIRASRKFVRTVRGRYIKDTSLDERRGSGFHGVELRGTVQLPIAWTVRATTPLKKITRADGTVKFIEDPTAAPLARQTLVGWETRERAPDGRVMHVLKDGHYVKDWFLAVAEVIARPKGIKDDETWAHIDLSQQTLVLYRGATPIYATLVSSGMEGHETPVGVFTVRTKFVSDTMSAIGPDVGDDQYSIDDVPWTQYFSGSIALHGAFWHDRFGLQRSHGCVNLAPLDAHHVFDVLAPHVPRGWHGLSTERNGTETSHVVVTE